MCLAAPSVSAAPVAPVASPAPPPAKDPNPAVLASDANNDRANSDAKRRGTSIFRNDLSIPTAGGSGGGAVGAGLNIPR